MRVVAVVMEFRGASSCFAFLIEVRIASYSRGQLVWMDPTVVACPTSALLLFFLVLFSHRTPPSRCVVCTSFSFVPCTLVHLFFISSPPTPSPPPQQTSSTTALTKTKTTTTTTTNNCHFYITIYRRLFLYLYYIFLTSRYSNWIYIFSRIYLK